MSLGQATQHKTQNLARSRIKPFALNRTIVQANAVILTPVWTGIKNDMSDGMVPYSNETGKVPRDVVTYQSRDNVTYLG
jgi:hypothetical protein